MPAQRRRTRLAGVLLALAALVALGGCSAAEDAVNRATDDAKSQAASAASDAAAGVVRQQICNVVGDGSFTEQDVARLRELVDQAGQVGVPEEVLSPARELVQAGGNAGADQIAALRQECAAG